MTSAVALLLFAALTLTGCTSEASNIGVAKNKETNVVDTGFSVSTVGSYDSADTAVVLTKDESNKAVSLINMETGKQYTLYYDGTTYVKDKYEGPMTISQIKEGDIVDITFLKGKKKLASIQKSPKAWVYDGVSNYDLAGANKTASIGSKTYSLPAGVVVLSDGRRMGTEEVVSQDEVTISGIDHKIYSVNVDRGHGYLRLKNDQPLLGGWIEVGNRVIRQITEDMLLTVPEGSYQVVLDNNGIGCVKEITVERDKEVVLDVGDVEIAEDKTGIILFEVTPASAKISVDGKPIETGTAVELRYGIHQVVVEASGYDTLTKYIQVGSERAAISFTLEETRKSDKNDNSVSSNSAERIPWQDTLDSVKKDSVSKNDTLSQNALTTSNNNKVYVDSPKGVEVYLDGNYVGVAPVRFTKSPGRHEITLKKSGYKTKSYSIYLENNKRDETYSFSDLEKETSSGSDDDDNKTTSGSSSTKKKKIPSSVTTAVSGITYCQLTNGTHLDIKGTQATLKSAGISLVEAMVSDGVGEKIGREKAGKYTFTVGDVNLTNVTVPGETDGKGTVSITIARSDEHKNEYEKQTVSCEVTIKKGEASQKVIQVEVRPNTIAVKKGSTTDFEAYVTVDGVEIKSPSVVWNVNFTDKSDFKTEGRPSTLTVASDETASAFKVLATYTDEETKQSASGEATVTVVPDEVTVTVSSENGTVKQGESLPFSAEVKVNGDVVSNAALTWALSGQVDSGTMIGNDGLLKVSENEAAANLTITATYQHDGKAVSGTAEVAVTLKAPVSNNSI